MVNITVSYAGNKKCDLKHPEGATLRTDAPRDIGGDASAFSPTDLVAAGLASCIVTTMAMWAERNGVDLTGISASVEKHMSATPRRIGRVPVTVRVPATVATDMRARLEAVGNGCPVKASLHPDVEATVTYQYV